ncbi:MAG: acetyl-CoA hydrolase/transferase C-terminal domain-containing protein [Chloroflexota bacterium]
MTSSDEAIEALISIAHPDFRAELRSEARKLGLL